MDKRHGPPGINSRALSAAHSAADLEVLAEIENVYFSPRSEFDAGRHVLENTPFPPTCEDIEAMFTKLKRQQQVVSGKALHLISQQRDSCDREFAEIQTIREQLTQTLATCKQAREKLKQASDNLTLSTFVILANFRKRQIIKSVLKSLELLRSLRSVENDVTELLNKKEYEQAIKLILKSKKAASEHKEFTCIADLSVRLQDTLVITEEKLDSVLSSLCYKFDEVTFCKLRNTYNMLGKTQAAMEQLHMHYSSAVNECAIQAIRSCVSDKTELKFQDLCSYVPVVKGASCLLQLCEKLFFIMRSYYLLVQWHNENDTDTQKSDNVFEIEKNVSREYIRQKLKGGLVRIWHDVQAKVSVFLKSTSLDEYPFEKFILMLGILKRLTQAAEVFCGDTSELLNDFVKTQSMVYISNYHKGRMEELKLFLENEGWEQCPVKSNFTLLNLQEFRQFKKYIKPNLKSDISMASTFSDTASSVSQDESVYLKKYFNKKSNSSPFEIFHDETVTNDEIFGIENDDDNLIDSDDDPEELKRDTVEDIEPKSPVKMNESVIVTNTTLSVLRNCGQYLQICKYLPQICLQVIMLMNQLFDYYFYSVHLFFTSDLEVASSTLYSTKLTAALKRISNNIDPKLDNSDEETKHFGAPELPDHIVAGSEDSLHNLAERIVAVESVIFLSKQYESLQPYLESIVVNHQKMILEHFKDNTLASAVDLRMPVYMASVSKAFDARSALIAISQVKFDVKNVAVEHSSYVDLLVRKVQVLALRLETVATKVSLNSDICGTIWSLVSKFLVHLLVEGYSNSNKCSNAGRGLMQLDYRQLFVNLEKISGIKPLPYQDYVDRYVKAYYLPRSSLEDFVKERLEYSSKHLLALINCACENKRDRQELIAVLEGRDQQYVT